MAVKADYKNAIFSGSRRYHISENEDGTVSLTDVTQYIQKGDKFGAKDVNGIGDAINGLADSLSDAFSEEKSYKVGEYVIYDNKIYRFTVAKQAGPWEADKVEFAKVAKVVGEIYGNITALQNLMQSFNAAKSRIISSALGVVLGMTANTSLADIATKIASIVNRGTLNWSGNNTTFAVPAGYYPGGTLDSRPSYNSGYNAGVTAADNRANVNSANYKAGYNAGAAANALRSKKLYWELNAKSYETCGSFTAEKTGTHVFMFHTYTQDVPNRFQARALCNNTTISSIEGARNKTGWYFSVSLTVGNVVTFQMCNTYHPYNSALDGVVCY